MQLCLMVGGKNQMLILFVAKLGTFPIQQEFSRSMFNLIPFGR